MDQEEAAPIKKKQVLVIGGGIAGLCVGVMLDHFCKNMELVSVYEREGFSSAGGYAFLVHPDGVSMLKELQTLRGMEDSSMFPSGVPIRCFQLKDAQGNQVASHDLNGWECWKRADLHNYLTRLIQPGKYKAGFGFSKFIYNEQENRVIAAEFTNGEIVHGDVFIGADGANSDVRKSIIGEVKFQPGGVKEIVASAQIPKDLSDMIHGKCNKYQRKGIAFGIVPTSDRELVWYMQYDPMLDDIGENMDRAEAIRSLCYRLLGGFPPEVFAILSGTDFSNCYIWKTRDLDLLPQFHRYNVVLIGCAAHVALPFTSAGVVNAMRDAQILVNTMMVNDDEQESFFQFHEQRAVSLVDHVLFGRQLRDAFLQNPSSTLPIVSNE